MYCCAVFCVGSVVARAATVVVVCPTFNFWPAWIVVPRKLFSRLSSVTLRRYLLAMTPSDSPRRTVW